MTVETEPSVLTHMTHPIQIKLSDDDYDALQRAKTLLRRRFGLPTQPSHTQVVSWLLQHTPWEALQAETTESMATIEINRRGPHTCEHE